MNIIKLILAGIGLLFVGIVLLWVVGLMGSILSWVFWLGLIGIVGYGGYRLFRKIEDKTLGGGSRNGLGAGGADIKMSWDEYDKKYMHK